MNDLTHDRCSELLGAFASGELEERAREQVAGHLSSCPECSSELTALRALAPSQIEPMTGAERDQLTSAVRAAVIPAVRPRWSERLGRRAAPALGAAALLAVVALVAVSLPDSADQPAVSADTDATTGADRVENSDAELKAGAPPPAAQDETTESMEMEAATGTGGGAGAAGDAAGTLSSESAASSVPRAAMSTTVYDESFAIVGIDVGSLVPSKLPNQARASSADQFAETAPDARVAEFIRTCAERAITSSAVRLVPTSATYFPADDLLLIGFVWIDSSSGDLRFEIRGWRNGRCDRVTPIYQRGAVAQ